MSAFEKITKQVARVSFKSLNRSCLVHMQPPNPNPRALVWCSLNAFQFAKSVVTIAPALRACAEATGES